MIQKVSIEVQAQPGVQVKQEFEQVIDTADEAREYGEKAAELAHAFVAGFAEYDEGL
jgi:hypothetical protein